MPIQLRVETEGGTPREYHFNRDRIVLGCHPFSDIVVQEGGLSARHGQISVEDSRLRYHDLASRGWTVSRGEVEVAPPTDLEPGDVLVLGDGDGVRVTVLRFADHVVERVTHSCVTIPETSATTILDELPDGLSRTLLVAAGRMLGERTLTASSRALQELVAGTIGGEASFVLPSGEASFHDRVVMCAGDDCACAAWVSPDSAQILGRLASGDTVEVERDESGTAILRVPFVQGDPAVLLGYLRVQTPTVPDEDAIRALGRGCRWLQPTLLTIMTLEAVRDDLVQSVAENTYFRQEARRHYLYKELVIHSESMRRLYDRIHALLTNDDPVLIAGEAGCGKKMVARALHHLGHRRDGIFAVRNCATGTPDALEGELFGHAADPETGRGGSRGLLEIAAGGTVFIDEIDKMPMQVQTRLVRAINEREVRRLGEETGREADVRIIAATRANLLALARRGLFRRDLLGAFGYGTLRVPPLRERLEDLAPLTEAFVERYDRRYGLSVEGLSHDALERMRAYRWYGNVRELQLVVETAVLKARTGMITADHLELVPQSESGVAVETGEVGPIPATDLD